MKHVLIIAFVILSFAESESGSSKCSVFSAIKLATKLNKLVYVGDKDAPVVYNDDDIDEYCRDEVEEAIEIMNVVGCVPATAQKILKSLAVNRLHRVTNNCRSRKWRKMYIQFSKCHQSRNIHQCGYKLSKAFKLALKKNVEHQIPFACCAHFSINECIEREVGSECSYKSGSFALDLFWEPVENAYDIGCPGVSKSECYRIFGDQMLVLNDIFENEELLPANGYMTEGLKLMLNAHNRPPVHFSQIEPEE